MSAQKPRVVCPMCGAHEYHWWYCNATPEYIAWMADHTAGTPFTGKMRKDECTTESSTS